MIRNSEFNGGMSIPCNLTMAHLAPVSQTWFAQKLQKNGRTCIINIPHACNITPRPGVPPRGLSCDQLFRVCLQFVSGLFRVSLRVFGWLFFFTTVLVRFYFQGLLRVLCQIQGLGFIVKALFDSDITSLGWYWYLCLLQPTRPLVSSHYSLLLFFLPLVPPPSVLFLPFSVHILPLLAAQTFCIQRFTLACVPFECWIIC